MTAEEILTTIPGALVAERKSHAATTAELTAEKAAHAATMAQLKAEHEQRLASDEVAKAAAPAIKQVADFAILAEQATVALNAAQAPVASVAAPAK